MQLIAQSRHTKICIHVFCKNGLKQDVLLLLLFNFALECPIRRVLGRPGGLKINWHTSASVV